MGRRDRRGAGRVVYMLKIKVNLIREFGRRAHCELRAASLEAGGMHVRRRVPQSNLRSDVTRARSDGLNGKVREPIRSLLRHTCGVRSDSDSQPPALSPTSNTDGAARKSPKSSRGDSSASVCHCAISPLRQHPQSGNDKPPAPVRCSIRASWQSRAVKLRACHGATTPCILQRERDVFLYPVSTAPRA